MPIGFIPQDESHSDDDLGMATERWHSLRLLEALEFNKMIQATCEALQKRVRKYADQLECLDPLHHDAELAVGKVVLALSHDECAQERLETLLSETGRLMLAMAEARCGGSASAKRPHSRIGMA
jgi:hypothetical protein